MGRRGLEKIGEQHRQWLGNERKLSRNPEKFRMVAEMRRAKTDEIGES